MCRFLRRKNGKGKQKRKENEEKEKGGEERMKERKETDGWHIDNEEKVRMMEL